MEVTGFLIVPVTWDTHGQRWTEGPAFRVVARLRCQRLQKCP